MSPKRTLPEFTNPLMVEEKSPNYEILVERRCLGSTELKVKAGQVGTSNATQPDNLGILDYAHLRVPLPKDLSTSGIFHKGRDRKYPESYFLMRRSSDGYISATGMFKAAFPYAQVEEEAEEKAYIKGLKDTPDEEVAGNVWIHPDEALSLAEEYGIRHWILALLDPEPIEHGTGDSTTEVMSPPIYRKHKLEMNGTSASTKSPEKKTPGRQSTRGRPPRGARSASPAESATAARPKATPGRGRGRPRKNKAADDAASVASEAVNGDADTVKVEVETVEDGDDQKTKVKIDMPSTHPDLVLPEDAEGMLEQARQMVKDAEKISGGRGAKGKRKAADMVDEESEQGPAVSKRSKMEVQVQKERIRNRALAGSAVVLALGFVIPTVMSGLQSLA